MFTVKSFLLLLILGVQVEHNRIHARPQISDTTSNCPSHGIPQGSRRGINVIHGSKPVYRLDIGDLEKQGYLPGTQYEVRIKAQDPNHKFGNTLLWVQTESKICSTGILDTTKGMYYQPTQCPHMVYKDTRPSSYDFVFKWTAPNCGCILIRARVESADESVLFLEDEGVIDGHLTKRVCPKQDPLFLKQMSRQQKQQLLCNVTKVVTAEEVSQRVYVQTRRKVDYTMMPAIEKEAWMMVFDQKLYEVQQCCNMEATELEKCLNDVRRHRIDNFCLHGESIVPFTVKRRNFMKNREEECCWRLGEMRYQCFASGPMMDGTGRQFQAMENMDESDPVNDLEDFRTELGEKITEQNTEEESNDQVLEQEKMVGEEMEKSEIVKGMARSVDNNIKNDDVDDDDEDFSKKTAIVPSSLSPVVNKEKKQELSTLPSLFSTETSEVLKKRLQRAKTKLECCDMGKRYGSDYNGGDLWDRCEAEAHSTAKSYRSAKRRCKNFFMRCCIEESTRSHVGSVEDVDEEEIDENEEGQIQATEMSKENSEKDQTLIEDSKEIEGDDDIENTNENKRRNRNSQRRRRRRKNSKSTKRT